MLSPSLLLFRLRVERGGSCFGLSPKDVAATTSIIGANSSEITCRDCQVGQHRPSTNSSGMATDPTKCIECGIGTYQSEMGQPFCTKCDAGEAGTGFDGLCEPCNQGRYRNASMTAANCSICPAGWSSDIGSTKCLQCEGGKYGDIAGNACQNCQKGTYRGVSDNDLTKCIACAPGYYTNKTEQRFCLGCDAGQYSDRNGTHLCKDCPNGFFQDSKRMNSCNNKNTCPSERSEINTLKTACIKPEWKTAAECGDNQYLNNGFISRLNWTCSECPDGGDCNGPVTISTLLPKEGWWPIPLNQRTSPEIMFAKCLFTPSCQQNTSESSGNNQMMGRDCWIPF